MRMCISFHKEHTLEQQPVNHLKRLELTVLLWLARGYCRICVTNFFSQLSPPLLQQGTNLFLSSMVHPTVHLYKNLLVKWNIQNIFLKWGGLIQWCNEGQTWTGWDFGGFLCSDIVLLYSDFFLHARTRHSQPYSPSCWMKLSSRSLAETGFPCKKDCSLMPES